MVRKEAGVNTYYRRQSFHDLLQKRNSTVDSVPRSPRIIPSSFTLKSVFARQDLPSAFLRNGTVSKTAIREAVRKIAELKRTDPKKYKARIRSGSGKDVFLVVKHG